MPYWHKGAWVNRRTLAWAFPSSCLLSCLSSPPSTFFLFPLLCSVWWILLFSFFPAKGLSLNPQHWTKYFWLLLVFFPFKPVTKESRVGAYLCFVLTLHRQRITCLHKKNIPRLKAGLGSGSQKTHPHFILCLIFFLHQLVLKYATSMQADRHTSQVHIKWLYICWEMKWIREQLKEECSSQSLLPSE